MPILVRGFEPLNCPCSSSGHCADEPLAWCVQRHEFEQRWLSDRFGKRWRTSLDGLSLSDETGCCLVAQFDCQLSGSEFVGMTVAGRTPIVSGWTRQGERQQGAIQPTSSLRRSEPNGRLAE